ncbi:putative ribonuclease H-like domain-containing protein [Tanacetum coccineum]
MMNVPFLSFHNVPDAKSLWAAIKLRFGGNDESKKMQKNVLKHQFENFITTPNESLDKAYDRFQKLISQLEIHGASVSKEDINQKFLRSLPPSWSQIALIMRNKPDIDQIDTNDLYNNLRNTSSTNEVNTASGDLKLVLAAGKLFIQCQIDEDDLEELDLRWQVAMLTVNNLKMELEKVVKERDDQMSANDKNGLGYGTQMDELSNKSETDSEISMSVFEVRSSDKDITLANDRFFKVYGCHAVPPLITGNFLTPRADISFAGLDEYAIRKKIIESKTTELKTATSESKTSETVGKTNEVNVEKPRSVHESVMSKPKINRDKVIIRDWNSDDEDDVSAVETVNPVKTNKTQTVKTQVNKISQNSHKEGIGFKKIKACFICKSTDHLIKDCNFYDKKSPKPKLKNVVNTGQRVVKPVWDNAKRVNHQKISTKLKYPQARRTFIPSRVLTRTGFVNPVRPNEKRVVHTVSTARPISTVRPIITARPFSTARPFAPKLTQTGSAIRPIYPRMNNVRPRASYSPIKRVATVGTRTVVSAGKGKMENDLKKSRWVWRSKGNYMDHKSKESGSFMLKKFEAIQRLFYRIIQYDPKGGKITGKGKIKTANLDFNDVYFVDELKFNLFSVSQMCDKKNSVLFTDTECLILSPSFKLLDESQVVLRAPRQNDVYILDLKNIVPFGGITCLYANETTDESKLWHMRLGHVNFKNINKLVKGYLVRGLPSKVFVNDHTCVACKKGKQHKASCKAKLERTTKKPLELLHMDLFGHVSVESINKKKYCLVVTDDFSRFSWVFFLATKDETNEILYKFIIGLENQLNHKVKIIRCDHGTKFKNNAMNEFCAKKGIKREFSVARTPQQNGVAERKNRTLIEAARTMIADSLLPIPFWVEAVNTACYVLNKVLVTKPQNKTSYELLLGRPPSISFMRPFGCPLTILNTLDPLGKFDGNLMKDIAWIPTIYVENQVNVDAAVRYSPCGANAGGSSFVYLGGQIPIDASTLPNANLPCDPNMPDLEDDYDFFPNDGIFSGAFDGEDLGVAADFNNMDKTIDEEPKNISQALEDESWVEGNERELAAVQGYRRIGYLLIGHLGKRAIGNKDRGPLERSISSSTSRPLKTCSSKQSFKAKQQLDGIFISQDKYVADILKKFDFCSIKTTTTPIESNKPLVKDEDGVDVDVHVYRKSMDFRVEGSCASSFSHIWYALIHNLTIYDSLVKQFWQTATFRTLANGIQELVASIDNKEYTITEASIRSKIQLADATGDHIPLLPAMLAGATKDQGEGSANPTEPHPTLSPTITPVADEATTTGVRVETEGATTTTFSLDAGLDSGNIHESPLRSHEAPLPKGNTSRSAEDSLKLEELMEIIPKLESKIDNLEKELKETKQTLVNAVLTLVKKVKYLKVALQRKRKQVVLSDSEDEETENQGRNIQDIDDDPLVSLGRDYMEEKEADFVTPRKTVSTYNRRARSASKGKDISTGLDAEVEVNPGSIDLNTGSTDLNTGSTPVSTPSIVQKVNVIVPSPVKGQREGKAPMPTEDVQATKRTKAQIQQEEAGLAEAIRFQALQDEEAARQDHLDALLAKRISEEQELSEQQKKRKAKV